MKSCGPLGVLSRNLRSRGTYLASLFCVGVGLATTASAADPIVLDELWRIGGEEESEEYLIGVINEIATDGVGQVYLLDSQLNEIMIVSSEGEYLRSIGREGEGPGEFRRPGDLFFTSDGLVAVLQRFPGKIVLLTPDGEPAGEFPVPRTEDGGVYGLSGAQPTEAGVILEISERRRREGGMDFTRLLVRVDANGQIQQQFASAENSIDFASGTFNERNSFGGGWLWQAGEDGRVFTSADWEGYTIDVFSSDGGEAGQISREYTPRKRTAAEREDIKGRFVSRGRRRASMELEVSDTDRDVQRMYPGPNGTLWVLTSRGALDAPEGTIGTFDVFDSDGALMREISLQGEGNFARDGFFIAGNRFYVVTELVAARRAMSGQGESDEDADTEAIPVSVICYELPEL